MVGTCPDTTEWKGLLDGRLSAEAQARLEAHLESCPRCQLALEKLAVGSCGLDKAVRACGGTPAPAASALWPALADLQRLAQTVPAPKDTATIAPRDTALDFLAPSDAPGAVGRLGHFEVVRLIGQGGMGLVMQALDTHLQRQVAVKVLDPRMADNDVARQRFCREARAAARITHEHVVAVHHVAHEESNDLPFLVMQLVTGESLEQRLARGWRPTPLEVAKIGMQTAAGLAAAHAEGLIHRDIKPANILLEQGTDRVKLTDFGLARAAADLKLTSTGFVAGTPLYMSPEQAHGAAEMDGRSDLFSLGVVLYELSTGEVPFAGPTPLAVLKRLTEEAHRPVQQLNASVPGWLSDIIDRLLEKSPERRFQGAAEVAGVLAHHLAGAGSLSPLQVPGLVPGSTPQCPKVGRAAWWKRWLPVLIAAPVLAAGLALALPALWRDRGPAPLRAIDTGKEAAWSLGLSASNKVAVGLEDGTVKLWDVTTGGVLADLGKAHEGYVMSVAFSPDGAQLATAGEGPPVQLWSGTPLRAAKALKHDAGVNAVAYFPGGAQLVTGGRDGAVRTWRADGEPLRLFGKHDNAVNAVALSPDGKTLATTSSDRTVKLWDAESGQIRTTLTRHQRSVFGAAFHPDGRLLATGSYDTTVRLWDAVTGEEVAVLRGHKQDVGSVAFSPDGALLVSASEDTTARVWDVAARKPVAVLRGHERAVYAVAFSRDGKLLVTAGRDGQVLVWDAEALRR